MLFCGALHFHEAMASASEASNIARSIYVTGWLPIETAPHYEKPCVMFVVVAIDQKIGKRTRRNFYTTDPYCVWRENDGSFARWPHSFSPTHWFPLPDLRWTKIPSPRNDAIVSSDGGQASVRLTHIA